MYGQLPNNPIMSQYNSGDQSEREAPSFLVVAELLFYVLGKHLRSCRDGQLT